MKQILLSHPAKVKTRPGFGRTCIRRNTVNPRLRLCARAIVFFEIKRLRGKSKIRTKAVHHRNDAEIHIVLRLHKLRDVYKRQEP